MCGIFGIVTKRKNGFWQTDRDVFEEGLLCDSVRGKDSTGAFGVNKKGRVRIVKQAAEPSILFSTTNWNVFRNEITADYHAIVGHNRKATMGTISSENAHPFSEGDITLVHNGVIYDHKKLNAEVDVDSHALCHGFVDKGYEETLKNIFGAYALAWFNRSGKQLFLLRNEDRPLSLVETHDNLYFASEMDMLTWIIGRNGVKASDIVHKGLLTKWMLATIDVHPFKVTMKQLDLSPPMVHRPRFTEVNRKYFNQDDELRETQKGIFESDIKEHMRHIAENEKPRATFAARGDVPYALKSPILFKPVSGEEWGQGQIILSGIAYLPGRKPFSAKHWLPKETDQADVAEWLDQKVLTGTLKAIFPKSGFQKETTLFVDPIEIPRKVYTWGHGMIPQLEWEAIQMSSICDGCQSTLTGKISAFTRVTFTDIDHSGYKIFCPSCVLKNLPKDEKTQAEAGITKEDVDALQSCVASL